MATNTVNSTDDHIRRISRVSIISAIEELIWNGLDAGGDCVEVKFKDNDLGGIEEIHVIDYGQGIDFSILKRAFSLLGDSLKLDHKTNPDDRVYHGCEGRGRFKALSIGKRIEWITTYQENGSYLTYKITISDQNYNTYDYDDQPTESESMVTGTKVVISDITRDDIETLRTQSTRNKLIEKFALYLKKYPNVKIKYDGKYLDVELVINDISKIRIHDDNSTGDLDELHIIEWDIDIDGKTLFLCNDNGFARGEMRSIIRAKGHNFTSYLLSKKIEELYQDGNLVLKDMDPSLNRLIEDSRIHLKAHFQKKDVEDAKSIIESWKEDKVYPYADEELTDPIKKAESQVFNIVALNINTYHKDFSSSQNTNKRLTFELIQKALETNPSSLRKIFHEIIELPKKAQDALAELLDETNLKSIINSASIVVKRLKIIEGFKEILYGEEYSKTLKERAQLHKMLEGNCWLFGEQYSLEASDKSLKEVLRQHIGILGRQDFLSSEDIDSIKDLRDIPDMMLSRRYNRNHDYFEHLIIEIKRPSIAIGREEMNQITEYSDKIIDDPRFSKVNVDWKFMLIGNEFEPVAEREAYESEAPNNRIRKYGNSEIWLFKWNDVLDKAQVRHEFVREQLEYEPSFEKGLEYLKKHYADIL